MFDREKKYQSREGGLSRRSLLLAGSAAIAGVAIYTHRGSRRVEAKDAMPKEVKLVQFSDDGKQLDVVTLPTIVKSDGEWKQQLPLDSYEVTRQEGTEGPFTGALLKVHDKGVFRCICCDTALFSSETKFESGTGWPSFWQPIAKENVHEISDSSFGMVRVAVSCRRCEAHLGHVFDDGPKPTGLRYCMNSVALKFAKSA